MTNNMLPPNRPQLTRADAEKLLSAVDLSSYPVKLLGIRGYFKKTMGDPGKNDIGIYDDSICLITPDQFFSFNFNSDPSRVFSGVAVLKPGGPYLYKIGLHGMHHLNLHLTEDQKIYDQLIKTRKDVTVPGRLVPYWALRQFSNVTVIRNGKEYTDGPDYRFFIDIHRGGHNTTSSLGCQTIPPEQWEEFFWNQVTVLMKKYNQEVVPYCLVVHE